MTQGGCSSLQEASATDLWMGVGDRIGYLHRGSPGWVTDSRFSPASVAVEGDALRVSAYRAPPT